MPSANAVLDILTGGVTAGTARASKAVVLDSNKDLSGVRNLGVTNLDAGASGTAGSVDIFAGTASKGKTSITTTDNTTNTTTAIVIGAQAAARTYTLPDAGADAKIVLSRKPPSPKTADYTVLVTDSGTHFTNAGAAGSVNFTLPAVATSSGVEFWFHCTVDQAYVFTAPSTTLVGPNNAGRTTYTAGASGQRIGTHCQLYCDGAKWYIATHLNGLTLGAFA